MRASYRRFAASVSVLIVAAGVVAVSGRAQAAPTAQYLIATGTNVGGGPHVKLFTTDGVQRSSFFAYDPAFRGGVNVAVGDLDGDGLLEIITGAGPGGGPHVRVFTEGGTSIDAASFFAYPIGFDGGVNVGVSDVDGDGDDEILTAPASGGGPHVKVVDVTEEGLILEREFFAYDTAFLGGVSVAGAYVDSSNNEGIVVGAGPGGGPHVKTFRHDGVVMGSWFAYAVGYLGGVQVSSWFANDDEVEEILTASMDGPGHVRSFSIMGAASGPNFFAFGGATRGANVGSIGDSAGGPLVVAPYTAGSGVTGRTAGGGATALTINPYPGFLGGMRMAIGFGIFDSDPTATTSSTTTSASTSSTTSTSTTTSTTLAT